MRFKKSIIIPVYVYTEEELKQKDLGLDIKDLGNRETEDRAFWSIDSANPERENPENTVFYSGAENYVAPCNFKIFVELIDKHIEKCG